MNFQDLERIHVQSRSAGQDQDGEDLLSLTDASSASSEKDKGSSSVEGFDAALDEVCLRDLDGFAVLCKGIVSACDMRGCEISRDCLSSL